MDLINTLKIDLTAKQNYWCRRTSIYVDTLFYFPPHQRYQLLGSHWIWQNSTVKCSLTGVYDSGKPDQGKVATVVTMNAEKVNGVGGIAPLILSLDTRWR